MNRLSFMQRCFTLLGIPFITLNSTILEEELLEHGVVTMGIDVGRNLHWRIVKWSRQNNAQDINDAMLPKVIEFRKIDE